jgi:HlyD family secretion protein
LKRWQIVTIVVIVIAVIIGLSLKGGGPKGEKVYVEKVTRRDVESVVTANGEIDPKLKVNISAHSMGKIERLYVKEGDIVQKGQKLVDLERNIYAASRDRAGAELANRRIEVTRARAALRNAQLQFNRAKQMQEQGIQARELFDRASLDLDTARAALASAEEGVRQAQATVVQSSEDLSRTSIYSPIAGKVVQLSAQEGEVVITGTMNNPGSVIAVVADLSDVIVKADVPETEVINTRIGQPARVSVDAVSDREYKGRVVEIGSSAVVKPGSTSGIRYFAVKVAVTDPDDRLRPGMTSQVDIITELSSKVFAVPVQSVVERSSKDPKAAEDDDEDTPKRKYVFVVEKDRVKMVEVTTGTSSSTLVAIKSGLTEGQQIVTGPFRTLKKLKDKDPVQIQKEKKTVGEDDEEAEVKVD